MGEILCADFRNKKYLGKFEQPKTEQEELTRLAKEIMGIATEQPFYESSLGITPASVARSALSPTGESSVGYWAPEQDPA